jgi:hypothetical protein
MKVGSFGRLRENFRLTPELKGKFTEKLCLDPESFAGRKVNEVVRQDGLRLVRVGSEAPSRWGLQKLSTSAKPWIFE